MGLIKDAFAETGLFRKKTAEPNEDKMKRIEKLEKELQESKRLVQEKMQLEKPEEPKVIALQKPKSHVAEEIPLSSISEKPQEENLDRISILEQNLIVVIQDLDDRLSAVERFIVKNTR